jgi:hypothetical protein
MMLKNYLISLICIGSNLLFLGFAIPPSLDPDSWDMEASGFTVTSVSVSHGSGGPWRFTPTVPNDGYACSVNFNSVLNWRQWPQFNDGGKARLSGKGVGKKGTVFKDLTCAYRTAWELADSKFGHDNTTLSVAIACSVGMNAEIGTYEFRRDAKYGDICRVLSETGAHMSLSLWGKNKTVSAKFRTNSHIDRLTSFTNSSRLISKIVGESVGAGEPHFAVCTVQPFRSVYTGFMLFMFIQHYLGLGMHVIVYDHGGAHKPELESLLGLPGFDYHPYTVTERLFPSHSENVGGKDDFKLYYGTEKGKKKKSLTHKTKVNKIDLTLSLDREKSSTYDHARIEYAHLSGIFFVDSDEFLYCPATDHAVLSHLNSNSNSDNNNNNDNKLVVSAATLTLSPQQQREAINNVLRRLSLAGIEEVRVDTHPYKAAAPDTVESLAGCLKTGYDKTIASSSSQDSAASLKGLIAMHSCFTNQSSLQTWAKSADLGRRCPFHYNHWSCDGGRAGGRMLNCRCRVAVRPWFKKEGLERVSESCHLVHYNSNAWRKSEYSKYHGKVFDTNFIGPSPIAQVLLH